MNRYIVTYNTIEGYHKYKDAPERLSYLSNRHRHIFVVRCKFQVSHNNREIEINERQSEINKYLLTKYNVNGSCEFGCMSCEDIAEDIIKNLGANEVTVLEDNYGGATLSR